MATLTEEQKTRIEENKCKALAIRAAKQNASTLRTPPVTVDNYSVAPVAPTFSAQSNSSVLPIIRNNYSNASKTSGNSAKPNNVPYNNSNNWQFSKPKSLVPDSVNNVLPKSLVQVTLSLKSKDRFIADVPYNKNIVEILKSIPGKLYDPKAVQWNFPLSSYQQCKKALEDSKKCTVVPLPNFIIKMFFNQKSVNTDFKTIDISRVDESLSTYLYPFQREGVQFGISKNGRCIIADDMGLGKTIQALGIASYYFTDWPLLIVCPSSMRYQWEEEVRNYLPRVPVTKIFILSKSKDQIYNPLVLITSYELMSRCESQLMTMGFGVIILDESHSIKSMSTNRTKTALKLISKAKRCILLSGTPALSRPMELYAQMKAVEPKMPPFKDYGLRYCDAKETYFGWDYTGSSNMEELKILLQDRFMIRRLKSAVLDQLPSKIRQVVILDKDAVQIDSKTNSAFTSKLDSNEIKGSERRGCLLSYYAETAKMKLKAIKNYICQILEAGNKFLVFCHHKTVMDAICELLEEKKTYFIRIDGRVNSEERKSVCDQFQTEDKFRVAVLSITAASTGLTLTAAHLVVFAELFWNPGILTQAEDRVHRIGQQDSVLIQYLIASGTADDYMWPLIKEKLNILNQAGLSKDTFSCERTSVKSDAKHDKTIMDFFSSDGFDGEMSGDIDLDLSKIVDEVEETSCKRAKLNESDDSRST